MPTASDLVTDLPADFEVFGQAVDTSLADLKGGTTGQVLSKTSGTDMDFTWVDTDDTNAIQNAIVDAKGDLIAASAADTPARLAVGNNGETLVADSSTSTGLRYTAGNPIPNPTLNSAMQIWQRGTSFSLAASTSYLNGFVADRWQTTTNANQATTVSRQVTGDTTNLPNIQYALRHQRNSGQTGTGEYALLQNFESMNVVPFAGKTVTFSFYARAGANYSATSNALAARLWTGTGTNGNIYAGFAGQTNLINTTATLTTTWQRFTFTATLGSNTSELAVGWTWNPTGTAGAADYIDLTGVQIDIGSVALPFRTNGSTIQGELAACQRYYQRFVATNSFGNLGQGFAANTTVAYLQVPLKTTMRIAPTVFDRSGTQIADYNAGYSTGTFAIYTSGTNADIATVSYTHGSAALTQYRPYTLSGNGTTDYVGFGAEL